MNRSITIDPGVKSIFVGVRALEPTDDTVLSQDERERADRFHSGVDRERWVAGRSWLRTSLGARLDVDPTDIRFEYGPRGKPMIAWPQSSLAFSLSHSGPHAILAMGEIERLGIDVERFQPGAFERRAAELVLSEDEIAWVEQGHDRDERFLRCWVRKEAFGKALGLGLDPSLRTVRLTPSAFDVAAGLRVLDLNTPGFVAALAVPSGCRVMIREVGI